MKMSLMEKVAVIAAILRDNGKNAEDLDDMVHDTMADYASKMNCDGMEGQLESLLRQGVLASRVLAEQGLGSTLGAVDYKPEFDRDFTVTDHPFDQQELMAIFGVAMNALAKVAPFDTTPVVIELNRAEMEKIRDKLINFIADANGIIINRCHISAKAHSDDWKAKADFNAHLWFDQASDEEVIDLAENGWGGDYSADVVALFMEERSLVIESLFEYIQISKMGYEVEINPDEAAAWLEKHRPHLYADLKRRELL